MAHHLWTKTTSEWLLFMNKDHSWTTTHLWTKTTYKKEHHLWTKIAHEQRPTYELMKYYEQILLTIYHHLSMKTTHEQSHIHKHNWPNKSLMNIQAICVPFLCWLQFLGLAVFHHNFCNTRHSDIPTIAFYMHSRLMSACS